MHVRFTTMTTLAVAGACLALAGCSSSTSGKGTASTPPAGSSTAQSQAASTPAVTSSAPAPSPSTSSTTATDIAAIVVQQSDLPAGWTAAKHEVDPNDKADQAKLRACAGVRNTAADEIKKVNSPDYNQGDSTIMSSISVYKSQADVSTDSALLRSSKIDACYQRLIVADLAKTLPAGAKVDSVSVHVTPGSGGGPRNVVGTSTGMITVSAQGKTIKIYDNSAFITGPRIEALVDMSSVGARVPAALRTALIAKVAQRAGG